MQRLLFKRTLRDLKANLFRYAALLLLIVLAMDIVVGIVGSDESVIGSVNNAAESTNLEDGEFGVFVPLKKKTVEELANKGVQLEESFYIDFSQNDSSTLRIMKNRNDINRIKLYSGRLAETNNEIVLERLYAAARGISINDTIDIGGKSFTVTGVGTSSDYDLCLGKMSDMSADGRVFGTAFVTSNAYESLVSTGMALHTQEYRYSYRLAGSFTDDNLKDYLLKLKVSPNDVKDTFFKQMVHNKTKDRDESTNGIKELADGSGKLAGAIADLNSGTKDLNGGIQAAYDGLKNLNSNSFDLTNGSNQMLSALQALQKSSEDLSFSLDSIQRLREASAALVLGTNELNFGLKSLSDSVSASSFKEAMSAALGQCGADISNLSPDAKILLAAAEKYVDAVDGRLGDAASGAKTLHENFLAFDKAMDTLPDSMAALKKGISQFQAAIAELSTEYSSLDKGISSYIDGINQLCNAFLQISEGSEKLSSGAEKLKNSGAEFKNGVIELQKKTDDLMDEYFPYEVENLTDFVKASDNPRIKGSNRDVEISRSVGIMAGAIVLILITYVISIFVVHSIEKESAMIGALYALGVKRKQLMFHYTMLPVFLCFIGGVLGTLLGYSSFNIKLLTGETFSYYSTPEILTVYKSYLLVYGLILPPLIALIVNCLVIRRKLKRSALSLLRKEQTRSKFSNRQLKTNSFLYTFQIRQLFREKRSTFAVLAGMFISLLILILGLNCYSLCNNIKVQNLKDTKYEFMYQYKYPTEKPPLGGYEAYIEGLKKEVLGYDMEVSLIGLTNDNPFFPAFNSKRSDEISISSSVSTKYGLNVGDDLILRDSVNDKSYAFRVKEIVPYSAGMSCFMSIDSIRELFNKEDDYYNAVYSENELDIKPGRLYNISTKADVIKSADIFMEIMISMVVTMISTSAIIFLIVLYQMMKVMIDRSSTSISLMKIFGYRSKEIRKLYLDGNFIVIAVGALIMIPIAKLLMDAVYPVFVANVACGIDLSWTPIMYVSIYAGIILSYLLIRTLLMRQLKKVTPAEILKGRE